LINKLALRHAQLLLRWVTLMTGLNKKFELMLMRCA